MPDRPEDSVPVTRDPNARIAGALSIAAPLLHDEIGVVRRVASFAGNRVYRVRTDSETIYVKFADPLDVDRELAVQAEAARHGIPVPDVIAARADAELPHIVTREVQGQPLEPDDAPRLRPVLHRLHAIELDGFGSVQRGPDGRLAAPGATWSQTIFSRARSAERAVGAGVLGGALFGRAMALLDTLSSDFDQVTVSRLLHGDLTMRHVWGDPSAITALIDWGDATAGDPLYDIGRLAHSATQALGVDRALELAFAASSATAPPDRRLVLAYAAVFTLWSIHGELSSSDPYPPFFPAQEAVLGRLLEAAARSHD